MQYRPQSRAARREDPGKDEVQQDEEEEDYEEDEEDFESDEEEEPRPAAGRSEREEEGIYDQYAQYNLSDDDSDEDGDDDDDDDEYDESDDEHAARKSNNANDDESPPQEKIKIFNPIFIGIKIEHVFFFKFSIFAKSSRIFNLGSV